ncbi:MAG: tetratricopeptide repeat protein [Sphingobacteriales bacterium]|nr:MAG: tetratricopeptide repeat protein [Sphingobacteriales bacterium]
MKRCLFLLVLVFVAQYAMAQSRIDSLLTAYGEANASEKNSITKDISRDLAKLDPEQVKNYGETIIAKNKQSEDKELAALSNEAYAIYYFRKGEFNEALPYNTKSLDLFTQTNNRYGLALANNSMGNILHAQSDFQAAVKYHLNSLKIREELKDEKGMGASYNNIANAYRALMQPKKALEYHKLSLAIKEKQNDTKAIALALSNVANTYWQLGDTQNALKISKQALVIQHKLNDVKMLGTTYNSLGFMSIRMGKFDAAMQYLKESLKYRLQLGDKSDLATVYFNFGNLYSQKEDFANAKKYLGMSMDLAKEGGDKGLILDLNKILAHIAEQEKDFKTSIDLLENASKYQDSIFKLEGQRALAEMQTKYETEKKEAAIKLLEKDNELKDARNKQQLYIACGVIILLLVVGIFLYSILKAQQQKRLANERLEVEKQRLNTVIQTQEEERKRISAELHDGIGPILSAVKINLSMLDHNPENAERYATAMSLIDRSYNELRQISHTMMPAMLAKTGLSQTLQEMVFNLNKAGKSEFNFYGDDEPERFSEQVEVNAYRIAQELLNNIMKYAKATEVTVQLHKENDELSLMIEDDGEGFDVNELYQSKGNGWANMQSRLNLLEGNIEIDSKLGKKGTVVHVIVPLKTTAENPALQTA